MKGKGISGQRRLRPAFYTENRLFVDLILIELVRFLVGKAFVYDFGNGCAHLYRVIALEDVAAHVQAAAPP